MNFRAMLKELEKARPSPAEISKAAALLKRAGFRVQSPYTWNEGKISPSRQKPTRTTPAPLPGWDEHVRNQPDPDDDLLQGQMFEVESSNVHSIGMQIENKGDRTGTLKVRYLAQHKGGVRAGPGSLYGYFEVPVSLFREFQRADSKGEWVWRNLRVLGTVAGHKYEYELLGITGQFVAGRQIESYVPRQAALRRGQGGQHFITRTFREGRLLAPGRFGTVKVKSQLAPSVASMRGPNPSRGPGPDELRFM